MEAQDGLNKYGRVKEAFVFEATDDSIRKKQLATSRRGKKGPSRKETKSSFRMILISALVVVPLITGAFIWQSFASSGASPDAVILAAAIQKTELENQDPDKAAEILVDSREKEQEPSSRDENLKLDSVDQKALLVSNKISSKNSTAKRSSEQPSIVASTQETKAKSPRKYVWIVYSAANENEADLKTAEFLKSGVKVLRFAKNTSKGKRVRLAWATTFTGYRKALKAKEDLPSVFSSESWLYEIN